MSPWLYRRRDAGFPYQTWSPFPPEAIVQVRNTYKESRIGPASSFWWGWEHGNQDGVIMSARRLDRPRVANTPQERAETAKAVAAVRYSI